MLVAVVGTSFGPGAPGSLVQLQQPAHRYVEHRFVQPAGTYRSDDVPVQNAFGRRHLEIQTRRQPGHPVVDRTPVRHDQTVEAPFVAQHVVSSHGCSDAYVPLILL